MRYVIIAVVVAGALIWDFTQNKAHYTTLAVNAFHKQVNRLF